MQNFMPIFIEKGMLKNSDTLLGSQLLKQLQIQQSYTHLSETELQKFQTSETNPYQWLKLLNNEL